MAGLGHPTPNPQQGRGLPVGCSLGMLKLGGRQLEEGARGADTGCPAQVDTAGPTLTCTHPAPWTGLSQCATSCLGPGTCEGPGRREDGAPEHHGTCPFLSSSFMRRGFSGTGTRVSVMPLTLGSTSP